MIEQVIYMLETKQQKIKFENGIAKLFDGYNWRDAQLIICKECGISWYIRKDKKLKQFLCKSCNFKGRRNSMHGKKSWNSGIKTYDRIRFLRGRKAKFVKERGDKCELCGKENLPLPCYVFHHIDPEKKEFHVDEIWLWKEDKIKKELEKCVMVCANCHQILHHGEYKINDYL